MKTKLILLLFITALTIQSCKKEKIRGCMDVKSLNYNPNAEEDDGSCTYAPPTTEEKITAKWNLSIIKITDNINGVNQPPDLITFNSSTVDFKADKTYLVHHDDGTNDAGNWKLQDEEHLIMQTDTFNIVEITDNVFTFLDITSYDSGGNHHITETVTYLVK